MFLFFFAVNKTTLTNILRVPKVVILVVHFRFFQEADSRGKSKYELQMIPGYLIIKSVFYTLN